MEKSIASGNEHRAAEQLSITNFSEDNSPSVKIRFCGYCLEKTAHRNSVCDKCGSDNTLIQGFNSNLM